MTARGLFGSITLLCCALVAGCGGEDSSGPVAGVEDTGKTGCSADGDCEGGLVCDTASGACIACHPGETVCDGSQVRACASDGAGWIDGVNCDDGDPCTTGDACTGGTCATVLYTLCDDGDPCTTDVCNGATGACSNGPSGLPGCCEADGDCDDGQACTVDTCEVATGVCKNPGGPCAVDHLSFGEKGSGEGQLKDPRGIAIAAGGRVLIADTGNNRIAVFEADGTPAPSFGLEGSGDGELLQPVGVAVMGDGRVAVGDTGNARIAIFTADGEWVGAFDGKPGEGTALQSPTYLAPATVGAGLWIANTGKNEVLRVDVDDTQIGVTIGKTGSAEGNFRDPRGVVQTPGGLVLVADNQNGRVQAFEPTTGEVVGVYGKEGSGPGDFQFPTGLAVTPDGWVVVADAGNGRLQFFESCIPDCGGKECGDNGCGGSCGECLSTMTCEAGKCTGGTEGGAGCAESEAVLCDGCACQECVCAMDAFCCDPNNDPAARWDEACTAQCNLACGFVCPDKPVAMGAAQVAPTLEFSRELGVGRLISPVGVAPSAGGLLWSVDNVAAKVTSWRLAP